MFHSRNIRGCSWIKANHFHDLTEIVSYCDFEIETKYINVETFYKDFNAHFRICSFDIECSSTDGEFPRADREGH